MVEIVILQICLRLEIGSCEYEECAVSTERVKLDPGVKFYLNGCNYGNIICITGSFCWLYIFCGYPFFSGGHISRCSGHIKLSIILSEPRNYKNKKNLFYQISSL